MKVVERFIKYVKFDTTSDSQSGVYPSTTSQVEFLSMLAEELKLINVKVEFDGKYVVGSLPKTNSKKTLAFIAHVDTSPAVSGKGITPIITEYKGGDIVLPYTVISQKDLKKYVGQQIITSNGNTLLGADDKAGVAEIMSAVEKIVESKDIDRCNVKIVFTPDEEIGRGTEQLDVAKIGADFAYTIDGGDLGTVEYENFNACSVNLTINGRSIHPGAGYNAMKNAIDLFSEFHACFPKSERPVTTKDYQGFYMFESMSGDVEKVTAHIIIRDHDKQKFNDKKEFVVETVKLLNDKYGDKSFIVDIKDSYYNMKEVIDKNYHLIDNAYKAFQECKVIPSSVPIRGGTDGAWLSLKGLPCPNLSTGGVNFHAREEFIPVFALEKMVDVIIKLTKLYK